MTGWTVRLGVSLADHLWQSTAFVFIVWLLTRALKGARARIRHDLWLAASLKFLIPVAMLMQVGAWLPSPKHPAPQVVVRTAQAAEHPFEVLAAPSDRTPLVAMPVPENQTATVLVTYFGICWLAGSLAVFGFWVVRWRAALRTVRAAVPAVEGRELSILRVLKTRLGIRVPIHLLLSSETVEPGVYGFLRTELIWPRDLSDRLDDVHIEAILAHELLHVKRRDNALSVIHLLVKTLFWFHPLVWWMEGPMLQERERACDEAVLALGAGSDAYAEGLLRTCRFCIERPVAGVAGVNAGDLRERVLNIVSAPKLADLSPRTKALAALIALLVVAVPVLLGQAEGGSSKLHFDVASVRPNRSKSKPVSNVPLGPGRVYEQTGGILRSSNFTLLTYMEFAYKLADYQVATVKEKLPDWALQDHFNIEARTDKKNVTKDELRLMMQSLLEERFGLKVHYEDRRVPVYELALVKPGVLGPKLRRHVDDADCPAYAPHATDENGARVAELPDANASGFPTVCGALIGVPASAQDRYSFGARNLPMSFIASSFSSWGNLGRPVLDTTGLDGNYDFVLDYTPDPRPAYATIDSGGPSFQEALRKQLGLKLQPARAIVRFLVMDHVEAPTTN